MKVFKRFLILMVVLFAVLSIYSGCDDVDATDIVQTITVGSGIEIEGVWDNDYGYKEIITATEFSPFTGYIISYDNNANVLYYQAKEDDPYNASKFGRIVWTEITLSEGIESFYYCMEVYGRDTLADARADTTTSDPTDPGSGGCGGFSWTKLFTPFESPSSPVE